MTVGRSGDQTGTAQTGTASPQLAGRRPALEGRVAVVTGAARGIGRAIARRYACEGARVVIADLDEAGAHAVAAEIGEAALAVRFDVTRQNSTDALVAATVQRFGRLDGLVNNAGIFDLAPIAEITRESYARVFAVNVEDLLFTLQAAARQMIARNEAGNTGRAGTGRAGQAGHGARGGSIINLASQAGRRGEALVGVYCASKPAVISLDAERRARPDPTRHDRERDRPRRGGRGALDDVNRRFARHENLQPGEKKRRVAAAVPIGRMARPDEIAGLATFLAGDDARTIVAQTCGIDGGNWMA